MSNSKVKQ